MLNKNDISTQEFISSVLITINRYRDTYQNTLEDYLLALWALIKKYKDLSPSYSLFSKMISEAFEVIPREFDEEWLKYNERIIWKYQDDSEVIEVYREGGWTVLGIKDFELLRCTILHQISDLHRMSPKQLKDPLSYFGFRSPTADLWYNLDVFTYWECAIAGMEVRVSPDWQGKEVFSKRNWAVLAELLTLGQLYE